MIGFAGKGFSRSGLRKFVLFSSKKEHAEKMPKRSYPFDESFSSQYKIHIGQKELSHGVFGYKYKQEIFGKLLILTCF